MTAPLTALFPCAYCGGDVLFAEWDASDGLPVRCNRYSCVDNRTKGQQLAKAIEEGWRQEKAPCPNVVIAGPPCPDCASGIDRSTGVITSPPVTPCPSCMNANLRLRFPCIDDSMKYRVMASPGNRWLEREATE